MELTALTGVYPVMEGTREAGTLEVRRQGGYLRFQAACRSRGREVKRLLARGAENAVSLGVLIPRGDLWCLDKRFSPAELRALGLEEIRACFLHLPEGGWQPEPEPGRLLADGLLRRLCRGAQGALICQDAGKTLLALPLRSPFPLLPAFCMGSPRKLEGSTYLVFSVFEGRLGMISPKEGQNRSGDPKNR